MSMNQSAETTEITTKKNRDKIADYLSLVGEPVRLEIICLLFEKEKMCVSEIADMVDITVANASYHLNVLADAELCERQQHDKRVCYYTAETEFMKDLKQLLCR